jgi:uncharacterized protein YecE (DUF72 family)
VATAYGEPVYRVGTASWTDPTLLTAGFYPPSSKTAEARLRFYAKHFNTVEVDSTYYAVPSERNASLWAARTPADFHFNIKAFAWLTQHAAETRALPQSLKALLSHDVLRQPRVSTPPAEALALSFEMFHAALAPLRQANKLGCVLFQFPPWFTAREANEDYIRLCCTRMAGCQLAIEFRHASWFTSRTQRTLDFLAAHHLALVCVDAPQAAGIARPPYAATGPIAYVRLHGRNRQAWFRREGTAAQRFKYLYSDEELQECAGRVRELGDARTVYVMFNNCYADYGVRNALTMQQLLVETGG